MLDMTGKTVLITGASRGIGAAAAREFAAAGANVALVARGAEAISALAQDIGAAALPIVCDMADFDAVQAAVAACVARFGGLNVLINNAAVIDPIGHLDTVDPAEWSRLIDINLKGPFYAIRAALPAMIAGGGGTVLTVSSGAAHGPMEGWSAYCSSKAGAAMLTRCLDLECREQGIRAMGLSPGTVATRMQRQISASGINPISQLDWTAHIPAEWPARTLLWMCSPEADDFIGQEIALRDETIRKRVGLI